MKLTVLAALPLILSACSSPQPVSSIDISRVKSGADRNAVSIKIDAPLNKPVTFDNSQTTRYVSAIITDQRNDGKVVRKEFSTLSSGTTVRAQNKVNGDGERIISLNVRHECPPELTKFPSSADNEASIDLPMQKHVKQEQEVLIKPGEDILISGKGFNDNCAFPRIIVHPFE